MPHSIIHGDACFAYFNKIRGIPEVNFAASEMALVGKRLKDSKAQLFPEASALPKKMAAVSRVPESWIEPSGACLVQQFTRGLLVVMATKGETSIAASAAA